MGSWRKVGAFLGLVPDDSHRDEYVDDYPDSDSGDYPGEYSADYPARDYPADGYSPDGYDRGQGAPHRWAWAPSAESIESPRRQDADTAGRRACSHSLNLLCVSASPR